MWHLMMWKRRKMELIPLNDTPALQQRFNFMCQYSYDCWKRFEVADIATFVACLIFSSAASLLIIARHNSGQQLPSTLESACASPTVPSWTQWLVFFFSRNASFLAAAATTCAAGVATIRERFRWGDRAEIWHRFHAKAKCHGALYATCCPPYGTASSPTTTGRRIKFVNKMECMFAAAEVGSKSKATSDPTSSVSSTSVPPQAPLPLPHPASLPSSAATTTHPSNNGGDHADLFPADVAVDANDDDDSNSASI
jgi:hypothetical protein